MSLFQISVLKKHLNDLDKTVVAEAYKKHIDHFGNTEIQNNIRELKEEQYQEGFLRELFVNILGYTLNPQPNHNLTTEYKNEKDAKKADGAILKNGKAIAVIELKGTNTIDLGTVEQQAFNYKNNQAGCTYIITSNFEKLRLYIENAVEHVEFDLFNITLERFTLLYLCLQKDNLLNDVALKIKQQSATQEENITKKLYSDYSTFRNQLYTSIIALNPQYDKLVLFKKTQKLLDRFLFIFFAEDRLLLPPNSIREILKQWKQLKEELDSYVPLYDRFKKYFGYMNTGYKGAQHDIFAYNGGLFEPDDILDNIKIDDDVLFTHTQRLSDYDYDSEVDVNILGHIFEHSLNEIEEIQSEIEGTQTEKTKTKRKKDGVFYTPKYITKYIVDNTIGTLCTEKKNELQINEEEFSTNHKKTKKKELADKLETYRNWLLKLTICDPACGSGAFLNQALNFLIDEHRWIDEQQASLFKDSLVFPDVENNILENNLFGVDINDESVEIAKLSLWLRTAKKGRKLNKLNNNIKCGNSLIDDPAVAGVKAFNWQQQFPEVFANGGFDVVIGNPPYVRAELFISFRTYFENNYTVYNANGDLFSYFYEKSFSILKKQNGIFGFISNTFDKTTAGITLRNYLSKNINIVKYIDFTDVQIFEGATTYPIILIAKNFFNNLNEFAYIKIPKTNIINICINPSVSVSQESLKDDNWSFKSNDAVDLINKLLKLQPIKEIYGKCYYGVKTALNEAFIIPQEYEFGEHVKPILEGKELDKWISPKSVQQLIFFESKWTKKQYGDGLNEEQAIELVQKDFPNLMSHIIPLQDEARKRYDKGDYYWELRNCAYYKLFEQPKIVFPNLQNKNKFSFDDSCTYINAPAVILPTNDKSLLAILNSKIVWYFLTHICVIRSGGYIEVKPQYFEQIPIPEISEISKQKINEATELQISNTRAFQTLTTKFTTYFAGQNKLEKLSNKLEKWYELDFASFIAELNKAIKTVKGTPLTKKDEIEWMDVFNEYKQKAVALTTQIKTTDKEIDNMVYALYGLSEEEIRIVEGI